jgi:hypothetical protein
VSLEDLGNLGEFVGAMAVVITLVYLALQIRQNTAHLSQNTRTVQLAALEANVESGNRVRELLILNPEVAELYLKGLQGYSQLERPERLRFGMLVENLMGTLQGAYVRYVALEIDPDQLEGIATQLDSMLVHAGVREWWGRNRADHRSEFNELVRERVARLDAEPAA